MNRKSGRSLEIDWFHHLSPPPLSSQGLWHWMFAIYFHHNVTGAHDRDRSQAKLVGVGVGVGVGIGIVIQTGDRPRESRRLRSYVPGCYASAPCCCGWWDRNSLPLSALPR